MLDCYLQYATSVCVLDWRNNTGCEFELQIAGVPRVTLPSLALTVTIPPVAIVPDLTARAGIFEISILDRLLLNSENLNFKSSRSSHLLVLIQSLVGVYYLV